MEIGRQAVSSHHTCEYMRPVEVQRLLKLIIELRDIPLVITAYVIWKFYKGTKIIDLKDIPLTEALERAQADYEPEPKLPRWRKIVGFLWD